MGKKTLLSLFIFLLIIPFFICMANTNTRKDDSSAAGKNLLHEKDNNVVLNIDEKTAVQLAEIIMQKTYGELVLRQRPWKVTETEFEFKISGIPPNGNLWRGGVAEIVIRKTDAKVIKITHGK